MNMPRLWILSLVLLPGCFLPRQAPPELRYTVDAQSAFVHRGMVQNDNGVLQLGLNQSHETEGGGRFHLGAWGNMDLSNNTGDAWFPDGHEGRFSQIDLRAAYTRSFDGLNVRLALDNYNLPNGTEFPFGERGSTAEFAALISGDVGPVTPSLDVRYDFDEVDDFYIRGGLGTAVDVSEDLQLLVDLFAGWSSEGASLWAYGIEEAGVADVTGRVQLDWWIDQNTVARVFVGSSMLIDDDIEDWVELLGIETDPVWAGIGSTWFF